LENLNVPGLSGPGSFQSPKINFPGLAVITKTSKTIWSSIKLFGQRRDLAFPCVDHEVDIRSEGGTAFSGEVTYKTPNNCNIKIKKIFVENMSKADKFRRIVVPEVAI